MRTVALAVAIAIFLSSTCRAVHNSHPLDPLTPDEMIRSKEVIEKAHGSDFIYITVNLKEPPKAALHKYFLEGTQAPRSAYNRMSRTVLIENSGARSVFIADVNLDTRSIMKMEKVRPGVTLFANEDRVLPIVRNDSRFIARCKASGITDMSTVEASIAPIGYVADRPEYADLKIPVAVYPFTRNFKEDNHNAHPLDFMAVVDMISEKLVAIEELPNQRDPQKKQLKSLFSKKETNYDYRLLGKDFLRKNYKPINVSMPQGSNYILEGNVITWGSFKVHMSFNTREGVTINHVTYNDHGVIRPILYRGSLAEAGVFYADPRTPFHRKASLDETEVGFGLYVNELQDQVDCIGETRFISAPINDGNGNPILKKNIACVTEQDAGFLWKHTDLRSSRVNVVRARRLTITSVHCTGNNDYIFNWHFYEDGSIQYETQYTGIINIAPLAENADPMGYGTQVSPQLNAQHHQHLFTVRLDFEVDGAENTVIQSDKVGLGMGHHNPYGNGFTQRNTPLKTQETGRGKIDPLNGRVWIITNPNKKNPYTKGSVGWTLIPPSYQRMLLRTDGPLHPKFAYTDYDVWVTKYEDDQLFPAGDFSDNDFGVSRGLPEWVANSPNASIENTDIVLWFNYNPSHIPRTEEYPVIPVETLVVWLKPFNFFKQNPALDVPPPDYKRTDL